MQQFKCRHCGTVPYVKFYGYSLPQHGELDDVEFRVTYNDDGTYSVVAVQDNIEVLDWSTDPLLQRFGQAYYLGQALFEVEQMEEAECPMCGGPVEL